jgi:hypothetical protein
MWAPTLGTKGIFNTPIEAAILFFFEQSGCIIHSSVRRGDQASGRAEQRNEAKFIQKGEIMLVSSYTTNTRSGQ